MSFLPIVGRQLHVLARRPVHYWLRTGTVLLFCVAAAMCIWEGRWQDTTTVGRELFGVLSGLAFFGSLLLGVLSTADCISSEKRDGTLGLLFLTDLKGIDVVFGKLVAHGLTSLYLLGAVLPVMALPVLMGGVTGQQLWQMALVVLNGMFFALSAGILVSVLARGTRAAYLFTVLLVGLITLGLPLGEGLFHALTTGNYHGPVIGRIGPLMGYIAAIATGMLPNRNEYFWQSVLSTHLLGWGFLMAAASIIPRVWQERGLTVKQLKFRERMTRWSIGNSTERAAYRRAMLDRNPICWLDDRYRLQKSLLWAAFLSVLTFLMWMFTLYPADFLSGEAVIFSIVASQCVLLIWVALWATHRLAEDKRSGALELLLATPISVDEIVAGRLLAIRRHFGWVLLCLYGVSILAYSGMVCFEWYKRPWWGWGSDSEITLMIGLGVAGFVMFLMYVRSIVVTSQWLALTAANAMIATALTLGLVVGLHWGVVFFCMMVFEWFDQAITLPFRDEWWALAMWLIFGIINCRYWTRWSQRRLDLHFRDVAARVPLQPNRWQRLARRLKLAS